MRSEDARRRWSVGGLPQAEAARHEFLCSKLTELERQLEELRELGMKALELLQELERRHQP